MAPGDRSIVVTAVFEMDYHYPKETWTFFSAAVAFLLTSKLSLAYARYWEVCAAASACACVHVPRVCVHTLARALATCSA